MRLLQDVFDEHEDLWQAWSVVIQQYTSSVGSRKRANWPRTRSSITRSWLDLGRSGGGLPGTGGSRGQIRPAAGRPCRARMELCGPRIGRCVEANDETEEARVILEQAVARSPLDRGQSRLLGGQSLDCRGPVRSNSSRGWVALRREAIDRLRIALKIDPDTTGHGVTSACGPNKSRSRNARSRSHVRFPGSVPATPRLARAGRMLHGTGLQRGSAGGPGSRD